MKVAHPPTIPKLPDDLRSIVDRIPEPDLVASKAARDRQADLTKPAGALGYLETLSIQLAGIQGRALPSMDRRAVITLAADHGVTASGVSRYPSVVTGQMIRNFLSGGAAVNVLARLTGTRLVVADVGVAAALTDLPVPAPHIRFVAATQGPGTANIAEGPAMTRAAAKAAIRFGAELVQTEHAKGLDAVAVGEMGIGNTTAASCLVAALTGADAELVTGRGTGVDDTQLAHKREIVRQALRVNQPDPRDPIGVLAAVGGFEIAAMVGVILGASSLRVAVVLDGFIAGAASLVAAAIAPACAPNLIAGHRSAEPGHRIALEHLGLRPLLDLDMRLGEGSGALLAMPILDAACATLRDMNTFQGASVSREVDGTA